MPAYTERADILALDAAFAARRPLVRDLFGALDHAQFNWQPAPGRWSVAQCLAHLCEVGGRWVDGLGPIVFAAMRKGVHHRTPHQPGALGRRVVGMMEAGGPAAKAPGLFRPDATSDYDHHDLLCRFDALGESWEATLRRACLLDTSRLWVASPAAFWFRLPLGTWLVALSAHEDRHLTQARRVMEAEGFPQHA
jgi:hypothetical protein